jgi:hypothetical protein
LPGCAGAIDLNYITLEFLSIPNNSNPPENKIPTKVEISSSINIRTSAWELDWGTAKKNRTVPVLDQKLDVKGEVWYSIPAWIKGELVKPKWD